MGLGELNNSNQFGGWGQNQSPLQQPNGIQIPGLQPATGNMPYSVGHNAHDSFWGSNNNLTNIHEINPWGAPQQAQAQSNFATFQRFSLNFSEQGKEKVVEVFKEFNNDSNSNMTFDQAMSMLSTYSPENLNAFLSTLDKSLKGLYADNPKDAAEKLRNLPKENQAEFLDAFTSQFPIKDTTFENAIGMLEKMDPATVSKFLASPKVQDLGNIAIETAHKNSLEQRQKTFPEIPPNQLDEALGMPGDIGNIFNVPSYFGVTMMAGDASFQNIMAGRQAKYELQNIISRVNAGIQFFQSEQSALPNENFDYGFGRYGDLPDGSPAKEASEQIYAQLKNKAQNELTLIAKRVENQITSIDTNIAAQESRKDAQDKAVSDAIQNTG